MELILIDSMIICIFTQKMVILIVTMATMSCVFNPVAGRSGMYGRRQRSGDGSSTQEISHVDQFNAYLVIFHYLSP